VAAAARAALACRGDRAELAVIGAWLGDLVLARRLGWPVTIPLLAAPLLTRSWHSLMGSGAAPVDWARWYACAGGGATHAVDLAADLGRRAALLLAAAPRLRAKAATKVVDELLSQDVLAASATLAGISDRGLRRLFERLLALGAVRELSGRPTFRFYGL